MSDAKSNTFLFQSKCNKVHHFFLLHTSRYTRASKLLLDIHRQFPLFASIPLVRLYLMQNSFSLLWRFPTNQKNGRVSFCYPALQLLQIAVECFRNELECSFERVFSALPEYHEISFKWSISRAQINIDVQIINKICSFFHSLLNSEFVFSTQN